ncbi:MAG: hypothetical protein ACFFCW_22820 [Candidatus Hodarchaeota archaeon]
MGRLVPVSLMFVACLLVSFMILPFQISPVYFMNAEERIVGTPKVRAQEVISPWNRTFGGGLDDAGYSVVEVSTGGFACAGYTMSSGAGEQDVWLVRTRDDGSPQWAQTYGGVFGDWGRSVQEVEDGGFIVVGETYSYGVGNGDYYLLRIDTEGSLLWNRTYGGLLTDSGRAVIELSDGGFAITGYTVSFGAGGYDIWVVRTDADGHHLWNQTYGSTGEDFGISIIEVSAGGFAIAGYTSSFGEGLSDIWLVRTDVNGNLLWSRTYGGPDYEYGLGIVEVSTGGFALIGYTESFGLGNDDFWLVRTDVDGNHLWNQTYGGGNIDRGWSVVEASTGGFTLAGHTESFGAGWSDIWVVRVDAEGNSLWNQTYGGSVHDMCRSIIEASSGGFIVLGHTGSFGAGLSDLWLIRVAEQVLFPFGFPIDLVLLLLVVVVIVVIAVIIVIFRRRRKKPQKRKRKK